ncbi:Shedu anti-phage system protein SduA domain-containing protein [Rheinheimera oceanensis]|uniref:Shedu anti-phage system protein SduA domain-containing protein n=1 Tax=Rheinheimera oceanensis TaxID=2817449 RepID=UPI001BFEE6EF|nr:Shedu anti-phage system protein SduA domain-containing protein [Rheinheimera oceanensis]
MEKKIGKHACISMENIIIDYFVHAIRDLCDKDSTFKNNIPGFLLSPKIITFYWFNNHIAISFEGDAHKKNPMAKSKPQFIHQALFSENEKTYVFSAVSGLDLKKSSSNNEIEATVSLEVISGNISRRGFLFSESSFTELKNLGWRIEELNTTGLILRFQEHAIPVDRAYNFQNIFIFHNATGSGVSSCHIKWLEVIPYRLTFNDNGEINGIYSSRSLIDNAALNAGLKKFFIPTSYEQLKFKTINRFIELWGYSSTKETTITRFLEKDSHKFILTMNFGAKDIHTELICSKFDGSNESIRPDFFIEKTNGFCDIVEFKLPRVTKPIIVGNNNRRRFASWFNTHLAQAKAYQRYFATPAHRKEVHKKYGIMVDRPTVTLVIGRRLDINTDEVREMMSEFQGINIISYDELVDGVVAQLYL